MFDAEIRALRYLHGRFKRDKHFKNCQADDYKANHKPQSGQHEKKHFLSK